MKQKHEKEMIKIGEAVRKIQKMNWKPASFLQKIKNFLKKLCQ